jgi:hypothetical protein
MTKENRNVHHNVGDKVPLFGSKLSWWINADFGFALSLEFESHYFQMVYHRPLSHLVFEIGEYKYTYVIAGEDHSLRREESLQESPFHSCVIEEDHHR